ncbi:MAG: hypothetical protein Q9202_003001 [Teloschistes flavicans]
MPASRICDSCASSLFNLYRFGFCINPSTTIRRRRPFALRRFAISHVRSFTLSSQTKRSDLHSTKDAVDSQQLAHTVTRTRQTFGNTLPEGFLSPEEYKLYERLYGSPVGPPNPHDVALLRDLMQAGVVGEDDQQNILFKEDEEGNLEKIGYAPKANKDAEVPESDAKLLVDETMGMLNGQEEGERSLDSDFDNRFATYRDEVEASGLMDKSPDTDEVQFDSHQSAIDEDVDEESEEQQGFEENEEDEEDVQPFQNFGSAYTNADVPKRHPLTVAGKWGTLSTTIQLPRDTMVDPISAIFAEASNKHLSEVAQKVFGGKFLPNSTATPTPKLVGENLKQSPIALEASQSSMGGMEANAYIAAIMPAAYATALSCLMDVRKRLGSEWLQSLLRREGGPRVLDAGAGGAAALAWRELLRAEWALTHDESSLENQRIPYGKTTVVTGSSSLRQRSSLLLDNTTFLPRLPDYNPSIDHPSLEQDKGTPRKQYDVILAPYTLWTLREDHVRKTHVQNLWSLLNPDGGVLIVIEKGVPRGFELVAGAREVLLKYHIASPGDERLENRIDEPFDGRYRDKETGMIIAPCTNHGKCPMYLFPGKAVGRRDYCHFNQRFIRPPFLQRILGRTNRNHEDVRFSFVAVQRGVDQRRIHDIQQNQEAEDEAFAGYGDIEIPSSGDGSEISLGQAAADGIAATKKAVHPLSFPRLILPPLKNRGHIILDACTPAGKIQRWTVPRSFGKQAYTDARKARWGDLWALGAKTSIQRRLKIGGKKEGKPDRQRLKVESQDLDDGEEVIQNSKAGRRSKKEKRPRRKTQAPENDLDE